MRILLLSARYPPDAVGGYEWAAFDVAERLAARGHQLLVLTGRPERACEAAGEGEVRRALVRVPERRGGQGPAASRLEGLRAYVRNYRVVQQTIADVAPDVLYVWAGAELTPAILAACEETRLPLVFHLEDAWILRAREQTGSPSLAGCLATGLKCVLAGLPRWETERWYTIYVSAALEQQHEQAGFTPGKAAVVHNGYDPKFAPRDWPPEPPPVYRVGYVGRLRPNKGLAPLLDALEHHSAEALPDMRLRIIGEGEISYEATLRERIRSGPLEDRVEWVGSMPRAQVLEAYRELDLLVVPSQWEEPFGLVAIEAMAAGVPVLATRRGGLVEIVDEACGWLCAPDPASLAHALVQALGSYARLREKGLAAPRRVMQEFAWRDKVDQIENVLQEAARGTSAPPPR